MFAEFAYGSDMTKFLENKAIPKFIPDGEDMFVESKDSYVKRKCKEKGIPEDEIHKQGERRGPGAKNGPRKFNAFREMGKVQQGHKADFAKIPEGVEIVGKAPEVASTDSGFKRKRDEEGEGNDAKREKKERPPVTFEYKGVTLEVGDNGELKDPSKVPFEDGAAVKFTVTGDGDWKELKEAVIAAAIPDVFMGLPAGQKVGTIAHQDSSKITDDEFAKLATSDLKYGGNAVTWERMSGESRRWGHLWSASYSFFIHKLTDRGGAARLLGQARRLPGQAQVPGGSRRTQVRVEVWRPWWRSWWWPRRSRSWWPWWPWPWRWRLPWWPWRPQG